MSKSVIKMKKDFLTIENFKCFKRAEIGFPNLTVLVGANGMGKSTIIQSLLLVRSSWENDEETVKLNGPYGLALGTNESVLNQEAENSKIAFTINEEGGQEVAKLFLRGDGEEEKLELEREYTQYSTIDGIFNNEFYYLSAERTGPRISQKMEPLSFLNTGIYGEYTGQVLGDKYLKIDEDRRHPNLETPYLPAHVNAWMNEILPGVEITADKSIGLQTSQIKIRNRIASDFVESTNIGFGISYSLPVVVQGLIAEKGRYFIVENPEAHLHPAAQTGMGMFLAMLAEKGLRVIIETHSDHLMDGIQLYATSHNNLRKDIVIYNFGIDENGNTEILPIQYDERMDYTQWPKGFMDQTNINYSKFVELR